MRNHAFSTHSTGCVHFNGPNVTPEHDGQIATDLLADGHTAEAHVGFLLVRCIHCWQSCLQEHHIYDICVTIPRHLSSAFTLKQPNAHVKVKRVANDASEWSVNRAGIAEQHTLHMTWTAHRHGQATERLVFALNGGEFVVILHANVLAIGADTPLLKKGVKCVGQVHADRWQ